MAATILRDEAAKGLGRALAVDVDLEGVQGGLAGLGGEAQGQARVDGREAGSVGGDEALRRGDFWQG